MAKLIVKDATSVEMKLIDMYIGMVCFVLKTNIEVRRTKTKMTVGPCCGTAMGFINQYVETLQEKSDFEMEWKN